LFLALAGLDLVALALFLVVRATDPAAFAAYVSGSPLYAGMIRNDGLDSTIAYATTSTTIIHFVITGMFLWLARTIGRGARSTRIRATIVLVISGAFNVVAALSPLGGVAQLVVMGASVVLKATALVLLWRPAR
jgi:low temperature requirement protein LtrA